MDFYHLRDEKQLFVTGLDAVKVVHKAGLFLWNKIADAISKTNDANIWETKTCFRKKYSTGKKRKNITQIKKSIIKMENYKISELLNN